MIVKIRLPRELFETMILDMRRIHPLAFERVGWVFAKQIAASKDEVLLLAADYSPVAEEDYVEDNHVGAKFNSAAIRTAMQRSRTSGLSCLQVHLHDHQGATSFSRVDIRTIDELTNSFRVVAPNVAHGGMVLSADSATARIWLPGMMSHTPSRVVIVGYPMRFGPRS